MKVLLHLMLISGLSILTVRGDCTLGRTDLLEASSNPNPGLYIDISTPASCTGFITSWNVCHYNPRSHTTESSLQIQLQVWRFDQALRTGNLVGSNVATIDVSAQPQNFQCLPIEISDKFINVTAGDFLGVQLPRDVLPVITNFRGVGSAPTLVHTPTNVIVPTSITRRAQGVVELSSNAIFVTAEIEAFGGPLPPPNPPTPAATRPMPSTTAGATPPASTATRGTPPDENTVPVDGTPTEGQTPTPGTVSTTTELAGDTVVTTQLGGGAIAAIVIIVLMLLAVLITGVAIVLILLLRRRSRYKEEPPTQDAFDNAVYDRPEIHQNNFAESTGTCLSQASTYEIPLSVSSRHTIQSILSNPHHQSPVPQPHLHHPSQPHLHHPSQPHPQGWAEDGANIYSTVESNSNGRVASKENGFVDSFETFQDSHEESDQMESSGQINPYATLTVVNIDYYNTFFKQATSALYANPDLKSREDPFYEPPNNEEDIYKILKKRTYTISRKEVKIHKKIGEGAFSTVSKGSWTRMGTEYEVAVKALIKSSTEIDKIKLLQEAAIMGQFQHPNIVKLFGVIKQGSLPMLVTEFLHKGDLLNTLQGLHPDPGQMVEAETPSLLLSYSQQVALGMHYLASKGFVHRDLAARNIFVTRDNICKVGDFGMSRELANTDYYVSKGGVVPVRWTAPEAIFYRKYSTASDVWSYGCLLYEIWTLGTRPYEGIATSKYLETLQCGYRLPPPPGCPKAIYSIMMKCWHPTTGDRPDFGDILADTLKDKKEVLSVPEKDALSHEQANCLGASLEAGLEMYRQLQNLYLSGRQGQKAKVDTKKRRYVNLQRPQPPPRVESKPARGGIGEKVTTLSKEDLVQREYEVEEEEEEEEENNGYTVLNGSD